MITLIRSSEFKKQFSKISARLQDRIEERLRMFLNDQFDSILDNHSLHGQDAGYRSINISGDLRLIFRVVESDIFLLVKIGTHHQLYEK
ncbi:MAG: type II toxin-antitoxin system mRNA interferase toxin, RelE/StbE family [Patescibacteria group bacterium]|nr:type II toxin-antitoxin system mRNA interferase toxin, RelE/StbE family [Patescibacteria group bacterium]MDE1940911.1 type II toxin-antitoxin system mRNA interferase toxin, RelE/StbE family [Patescibacteria group bacterium]MDE1966972.1 type II toxin-antitoxin system mRNA interferase toxin, RelE/StbE family [Patescibacteria group bacterium]